LEPITLQFEFTEEQTMIRQMVADFVRDHGSSQQIRLAMASELGFDQQSWHTLSVDLGLVGLLMPVAHGGQGLKLIDMALVFEQLGGCLMPSPLLQTGVLAATLLSSLPDEEIQRQWLPRIAVGDCAVSLAMLVNGVAEYVLGAHCADILILCETDKNHRLYVLDIGSGQHQDCIKVTRQPMMDQTRSASRVELLKTGLLARYQIAEGAQVASAVDRSSQFSHVAVAAEAVGAAQSCLDKTVDYVKERRQFGRVIGSFQAVKHQLADMMISIEAARSAVYFSACSVDENASQLPEMAALARVQASEALTQCASQMIQLHGGIGFTWEHDAHLYFKRARSTATLMASNSELDEVIAVQLGLKSQVMS
jgi:alkylation response protein AidB-like acyl-CoA dehydrogenase